MGSFVKAESSVVIVWGEGEGGMGSKCLMARGFRSEKMEKCWKWMVAIVT